MRLIAISAGRRLDSGVWSDEWIAALDALGPLTFVDDDGTLTEDDVAVLYRAHDVAIVGWTERTIPESLATDPGAVKDFAAFSRTTGHELVEQTTEGNVFRFVLRRKA